MPSLTLWPQSGGNALIDTDVYSGQHLPAGGITLKLSASGGPVYVGLPGPRLTGPTSGSSVTIGSGGPYGSGSIGGLRDGMELNPGGAYFIPTLRLTSGVLTPRVACPAASSGSRLYWECQ